MEGNDFVGPDDIANDLYARQKFIKISPFAFLQLFQWQKYMCISLPIFPDLNGAVMLGAWYDPIQDAFLIKMAKPDWPALKPGSDIPCIMWESKTIQIPNELMEHS
jgi:hypothetical protein